MTRIALANRARMRSSTKGALDFILIDAGTLGHQSFSEGGIQDGDRIRYGAETDDLSQWEVGLGIWNSATLTLVRDTIYDSSNSGNIVTFIDFPDVWVDAAKENFRFRERIVTSGSITVDVDTDDIIYIDKTVGAATAVALPSVANRESDRPITIVDAKGDAGTNAITITPDGSDTINGQANYVIEFDHGIITLRPYASGNKWIAF